MFRKLKVCLFGLEEKQAQYLVMTYAYDVVGMLEDLYARLGNPVDNILFGGEAANIEHYKIYLQTTRGLGETRICFSYEEP